MGMSLHSAGSSARPDLQLASSASFFGGMIDPLRTDPVSTSHVGVGGLQDDDQGEDGLDGGKKKRAKRKTPAIHVCEVCAQSFTNIIELKKHWALQHSGVEPVTCRYACTFECCILHAYWMIFGACMGLRIL
jgi:hypothetical protein